jgi:surface antigen
MSGRRFGLIMLLALTFSATVGASTVLADAAPNQWQPTGSDVVRTLRTCPTSLSSPTTPVCWSMVEDTSAWMAQPAGSPYPWGQCTYYVGVMRPDIWNDRAPPSVDPVNSWDAWTWGGHAKAEGLAVDGNPRPGDVMVYSRAAVGNDSGHVAIVDSVGGADPTTGDVPVTVSEMNVDGVDDASQGQGDTMTLMMPRSELVSGMVQFIHRPAAGYAPPVWPAGYGSSTARSAGQSLTAQDPSLAVRVVDNHIDIVSESTAVVSATVTALPSGTVVKQLSFSPNGEVGLGLPTGTYKVCVAQAPADGWSASGACVTAGWRSRLTGSVALGRPHRTGRLLSLPVTVGPQLALALAAAASPLVAQIRITVTPRLGAGPRRAVVARVTYTAARRLRAGRQVLTLPVAVPSARGVLVSVSVAVRGVPGIQIAPAQMSLRLV